MHYIRLLRRPKLVETGGVLSLDIVFTIANDLGDSLLSPDEDVDIFLDGEVPSEPDCPVFQPIPPGQIVWKRGMRVCKTKVPVSKVSKNILQAGVGITICLKADRSIPTVTEYVRTFEKQGRIFPAWAHVEYKTRPELTDVYTRRLFLDADEFLEVEENFGDSIARRFWDAGLVSFSAIAATCLKPSTGDEGSSCLATVKAMLTRKEPINILELGCGIGTLGAGIYRFLPNCPDWLSRPCEYTIVMTDLEDAEERARANISRAEKRAPKHSEVRRELIYENLDWEDARHSRFGPQVSQRCWDLIVIADCTYNTDTLPALVDSLSALHASNVEKSTNEGDFVTQVFLATKPRHDSERAVFGLLQEQGWTRRHKQIQPVTKGCPS